MRPMPDPAAPGQESVWRYPRPAAAERCGRHIRIEQAGVVVADTAAAVRTRETSHPPSWYIPQDAIASGLLRQREWFHYQARALSAPERYDRVAPWARATLAGHADDPRPDLETLGAMLRGETRDETWNACQRQFLRFGWMHNNLRMYWGKRIIWMTPDPETAWATACYLNDRLSLDGRDPATYGNIAAMFSGSPGYRERPVYGRVATRGDGSTRNRDGGAAWLAKAASRPAPAVDVPIGLPRERYSITSGHST